MNIAEFIEMVDKWDTMNDEQREAAMKKVQVFDKGKNIGVEGLMEKIAEAEALLDKNKNNKNRILH